MWAIAIDFFWKGVGFIASIFTRKDPQKEASNEIGLPDAPKPDESLQDALDRGPRPPDRR